MYFMELVTPEHKLGITTMCIKKAKKKKKNLAPERNGSNLFLIYPTSHSPHCLHASLSVTQPLPSPPAANVCRKVSNIVFLSYYPEDSPVPLTLPAPPLLTLPFYP